MKNRIAFNTVVLALMALIGGAVYSNSLRNGYHYDDIHHIVGNQYITTLRNIPLFFSDTKTFSSDPQGRNHYRPLVLTSYALNYYFGKLKPEGYHLVNLTFHVGSAFLVFLIVRAMPGGGITPTPSLPRQGGGGGTPHVKGSTTAALTAGLLFLATPFNSEVVNYISARSSVMCAFFYLLAFYFWIRFRSQKLEVRSQNKSYFLPLTSYFYFASLFAFLLAMLTKEIAITLPVMIFLYDMYFRRERRDRPSGLSFTPYVPFVMVAGVTGVLFRMIFCGNFLSPGIGASRGFGTQLFTELRLLLKYIYMTLVPVGLSVEHPVGYSTSLWEFRVLISMIVLLSIGGALFFLWRSKDIRYRIISFFGVWFFIAILPTTVIPLNAMFQENRGYLPGVGIMAIAGVILGFTPTLSLPRQGGGKKALLTSIVLVYGFMTYNRNMVWKDDITLWKDVQEKYPLSRNVPLELGRLYMADDPDLAEQEFKKILQRDPQDAAALNNLGNLYFNKGEFRLAEEMYLKAIEINPGEYKFHFNLARVYMERGDREQAAEEYREVLRLAPYFTPAAELLAGLYAEMGKGEVIEGAFQSASQNDPGNPAYHKGLGIAYAKQQKWDKAAEAFEKALEITPDDVQTRVDLGDSYMKMGEPDMAEREFRRALELEPGNGMANQGLGILYQQQEEYDLAIRHYERAIEGRIGSPKVLNNMGTIYLRTGKAGKAIETFKEALMLDPSYHMARINLGRAYESVRRYREAKEEYLKVIQWGDGRKVSDDMYREAKKRLEGLK